MKRSVNGVFCDTDAGTLVQSYLVRYSGCPCGAWTRKTLYMTPDGQYFIYRELGDANSTTASSICAVVGEGEARKLLAIRNKLRAETSHAETESIQGTERQGVRRTRRTFTVSNAVLALLLEESDQASKTISQLVDSALREHFNLNPPCKTKKPSGFDGTVQVAVTPFGLTATEKP